MKKVFRFMHGTSFQHVTEETVLAWKAGVNERYQANADKVLALEIGERVTFRGVSYERVADDTPPMSARICGRRSTRRCNFKVSQRGNCGADAPVLCDYPVARGKTCDAPRCRRHVRSVGNDVDWCIEHPKAVAS